MLLSITSAGHAARQAALLNGGAMSPIDRFVVGAGPAATDLVGASALAGIWYESPILTKEMISDSSAKLTAEVPSDVEGLMLEVGLVLEDGTLFAAAPFSPETGGQYKGAGFSFSFFGVVSDEDVTDLNITYAALDVDVLAQQIADEATARIDAAIDDSMAQIVTHLSGLNREVLAQQSKLNTLEVNHV